MIATKLKIKRANTPKAYLTTSDDDGTLLLPTQSVMPLSQYLSRLRAAARMQYIACQIDGVGIPLDTGFVSKAILENSETYRATATP